MPDGAENTCLDGATLADAVVSEAIRYLDSPTAYREFLPSIRPPSVMEEGKLVLLDDSPVTHPKLSAVTAIALLACTALVWWLRS